MNLDFRRHDSVPPFTRDLSSQDQVKWSSAISVPAVDDVVVIRMNHIGRATVTGYATVSGYLGVMCVPLSPPAWWVQQNGPPGLHNAALAFGAELDPTAAATRTTPTLSIQPAQDP